jgi:hypothetical protein
VRRRECCPRRREAAEAGERALRLALSRAGHQVTFREIAAAWQEANGVTLIASRGRNSWAYVFDPGIREGRVAVTRHGFLPFYTLRDGPAYALPEEPALQLTPFRLEISAAAEQAIALAQRRLGRWVTWGEIQDAWPEANNVPESPFRNPARAGYVTQPGRDAGTITLTREGGSTYYTLSHGPEYPLLPLRPEFTAARLAIAAGAEQALRVALRRHQRQVRWDEIKSVWGEANGKHARRPGAAALARWVFEPLVKRGSVIKTKRGPFTYYTLADGTGYSLPAPKPEFNAFRLADCATAERALALAIARAGTQVTVDAILAAWPDVNPETRLPARNTQYLSRIFEPGRKAGRVSFTKRGNLLYFGLVDRSDCEIPPRVRGPRVLSVRVRARIDAMLCVLACAVETAGVMVEAVTVHDAWPSAQNGVGRPLMDALQNDLAVACNEGRIRRVEKNRHVYYAPADCNDVQPPQYASNLHRVEVALARAVARLNSAVLIPHIEQEIAADPDLHRTADVPITDALGSLREWGRARTIDHLGRNRGYNYWSPPDGPHWVRPEAEHHFDRRYRAVLSLWRASHGRPFTTKALRRYASARPTFRTQDRHLLSWTNALNQFRENGDLVAIRVEGSRYRRWAPASAWRALSPAEQQARIRDLFGREIDPDAPVPVGHLGLTESATVHDVGFETIGNNLRTLVLAAKAIRSVVELDASRRRILRMRPVTVEDVKRAAATRPALVPKNASLAVALSSAVQQKGGRPPLASFGVVRGLWFIDVRSTPTGQAYVAYLTALNAAEPKTALRRLRRLRRAADDSLLRIVPLPSSVLDARAHLLATDLLQKARLLAAASRRAELLTEEQSDALEIIRRLRAWACEARALTCRPPEAPTVINLVEVAGLTTDAVVQQIGSLLVVNHGHYEVKNRLGTAGIVPPDEASFRLQKQRKRRPYNNLVDRVGFACYCAARWGGPSLASLAQQAWHAMGELRNPGPFIETLMDHAATATHASATAALGFYDDSTSRAALVEYLRRFAAEPGLVGRGTTVVAAETAALGLAPLPFGACATELSLSERQILGVVACDGVDDRIRRVAARVLRAWDEGWSRDQLLFL